MRSVHTKGLLQHSPIGGGCSCACVDASTCVIDWIKKKWNDSCCADMNRLPMHNALKHLAWLEGTWRTESPGEGKFPTIKSFNYEEEIKFTSIGQPMLNYESQTWHPEKKNPMHREVGFLRVIPETNRVKLILAHNFGVSSIEEGEVCDKTVFLESTCIRRMSEGTKDPAVVKLKREWKLDGNTLEQVVYMATSKTPDLTEHLRAKYVKLSAEA